MSSDIPTHCRAVVLTGINSPWTIKQIPVKQPQAGEILIKVLACGICHSDSFLHQGHLGEVFPRIPGHEVIGTVVKLGEGEKKWKVGDRVGGGWHGAHDGVCKSCNRGLFQMCEKEEINGVTRDGGCKFSLPFHLPGV
jgi:D-arabinose 1-dehydrogenase-like Zn-dependent alcohol dehydrogenase